MGGSGAGKQGAGDAEASGFFGQDCGRKIERGEGFYPGFLSPNYGVTLVCFLPPVLLRWPAGVPGDEIAGLLAVRRAAGG